MNSAALLLWGIWDSLYQRCTRLQYVDKGSNIFRIVLLRYRGEVLTTADNRHICPGDLILRLHIHNYRFAQLCKGVKDETRVVLLLRREILSSLPQLAQYVASLPQADQVKGIVGTTMLYKGVTRIGYSVSDVPMNWFFRYKKWYLRYLLLLVHPQGLKRFRQADVSQPLKRVYMSKEELFNRYLSSTS